MDATIPRARTLDRLMILAAALLFSTGGAAIKGCTMTGWQVASFRSGLAAAVILLLMPAARKGWSWRTWLVGASYAATLIQYALANKLTTAANTIFLQATAPLYVLALSPLLLGEKARRRDLALMVAMAAGIAMFFMAEEPSSRTATSPMLGNLFGIGSGLTYGLTIMGLRWLGRDRGSAGSGSGAAVACGNLIAFVAVLPMALPLRGATPADWWIVVYLGVFQVAIAYVFLTRGLTRVSALEGSLLLLAEPVFNPVWAWLAHGEVPAVPAAIGGAIILTSTLARAFSHRQAGSPDPSG